MSQGLSIAVWARGWPILAALVVVGGLVSSPGCVDPLERSEEQALRRNLLESHRKRIAAVADGGVTVTQREPSNVEQQLTDKRREQLDAMSGSEAYSDDPLDLGANLLGKANNQIVTMALREAVRTAVEHNLDFNVARLAPAISQAEVVRAEAAFDATFFTNVQFAKRDTPRPTPPSGGIPGFAGNTQQQNLSVTTGIRKPLTTGGQATLSTTFARNEQTPAVSGVPKFYDHDLTLELRQPLLRNFGTDVSTAQIVLARNQRRSDVQRLRRDLFQLVVEVENAYWNLSLARQRLLIQNRLLQRTVDDRDRLQNRKEFDVSPVRVTEANSFVELRRGEVIRARQAIRDASDRLKRLVNDPRIPVAGEKLLLPARRPTASPVELSLLDAVTTALRRRPELQDALVNIDSASVRQKLADNARLPVLDLQATVEYSGADRDNAVDALGNTVEGDFIDYLLGAEFRVPIGNRGPEAQYKRRRLERRQAVDQYRTQAQQVVVQVKQSMREVVSSYQLIGTARAARRAAADNLRAIDAREQAGVALTPEFLLDLKLGAQQRLADAELQESQALVDYRNAIAEFHRRTGTLLRHDGILFDAQRLKADP